MSSSESDNEHDQGNDVRRADQKDEYGQLCQTPF